MKLYGTDILHVFIFVVPIAHLQFPAIPTFNEASKATASCFRFSLGVFPCSRALLQRHC